MYVYIFLAKKDVKIVLYYRQSSEWLELKEKVHKPFNKIDPKFFRKLEIVSEDFIGQIRKIRNRQDEVRM